MPLKGFRLEGNIYIDKGMCKGSVALHWLLEVLGTRSIGKNLD